MHLSFTKFLFTSLFCSLLTQVAIAQPAIERKIIIENNRFYYFTVDPELQLATLHTGSKNENLQEGSTYRLPLGRGSSSPLMPLCFDINKGRLTYINWIQHSSFSRTEALKRIYLDDLDRYNKSSSEQLLQESIDISAIVTFEPWQTALRRNNVIDQTFFDMAINEDGAIEVWVSNGTDLMVWDYDGKSWEHSEPFAQSFSQYFSLVSVNKKLLFINHSMDQVIEYKADKGEEKTFLGQYDMSAAADQLHNLDQQILVVDKDSRKSWYFPARALEDKRISLDKLIKTKGTSFNLVKAVTTEK